VIEGQDHVVPPDVLAPIVTEFVIALERCPTKTQPLRDQDRLPDQARAEPGADPQGESCRLQVGLAAIHAGASAERIAVNDDVRACTPRVRCWFISGFTRGIDLLLIRGHLRNEEVSGLRPALKDESTASTTCVG
jgi:hypothetical protein